VNDGRISYESRVFSGVPQTTEILALPPSARHSLFEEGVPKYFFYRKYSADLDLSLINLEGCSPIVRFGSDRDGMVGVDSFDGTVIHIGNGPRKRFSFINTTIGKFSETARNLTERFPYGASLGDLDDNTAAANVMREIIQSIDTSAAVPGNYWADFADEVDGQLYGVEEILEWYLRKR
jgi:hypothetical protein